MALQPPSIPLTLRGMRRSRHRPLPSGRLSVALLSALALVAFACLPALAQANCVAGDSSCYQYETDIPTAGNGEEHKSKKNKSENQSEPKAEASESPSSKQGTAPSSEGSSEEPEEDKGSAATVGKDNGGNGPSDKGNGSPGGDGSKQAATGVDDEKPLSGTSPGQNAAQSDDGGSSPLVPILIAIAVLAAISIGAVIYRQRRQGSGGTGSPVSPNA